MRNEEYDMKRRAFNAYFRRFGKYADQLSQIVEFIEDNGKECINLSNVNGTLATYRIRADGSLKFLKRNPFSYFLSGDM